jgi:hypothetical protein
MIWSLPSISAVAGPSWTTTGSALASISPFRQEPMYCGMRMTPWES